MPICTYPTWVFSYLHTKGTSLHYESLDGAIQVAFFAIVVTVSDIYWSTFKYKTYFLDKHKTYKYVYAIEYHYMGHMGMGHNDY